MPNPENLTPWKPGQSGNLAGKPKGAKHLSTHIQDLLNDEEFTLENFLFNGKQFKGAPIKAIVTVAIMQALQGDQKWATWLAKYGYGDKLDITSKGERIIPILGGESIKDDSLIESGELKS